MYQDGHRRAKNQSNWSNASTVQVQKVSGPNILCAPLTFRWGPAPLFLRPCQMSRSNTLTFIWLTDPTKIHHSVKLHQHLTSYERFSYPENMKTALKVKGQGQMSPTPNHFRASKTHCRNLHQKTRLNDLSYGIQIWTDVFSSLLSQCTRLNVVYFYRNYFYRWTVGQRAFSWLYRPAFNEAR